MKLPFKNKETANLKKIKARKKKIRREGGGRKKMTS